MAFPRKTKNSELKDTLYSGPSTIHGTGLFAKCHIKKGKYIGTYHGPDAKRNGIYVLWVYDQGEEDKAVGRSGRNLLRYLNHEKFGNAEFDSFDLYARIGIKAGEEITFNYESE
ncbi:SET domain-containing protein-lysine N-methyltransferase [Candidatus Vondammii sp. HM_W22]|uniref:SET domain-containing protein-lysine N-methyltransferase n=1 Tax=Candidatus Vondammii sp. HM_W22 TaxID=2687299 RepID=UPI001F13EF9D|nr:SET domain-containing protein-lysine N-methyltransferase [Candidatus Vondammii sp. HM_W22]